VGAGVRRPELALVAAVVVAGVAAGCSGSGEADPPSSITLPRPTSTSMATTAPSTAPSTTAPAVTTTAPAPTAPVATAPATCPTWSDAIETGQLDVTLPETSGLATGRRSPGVLWAHNDSGNAPVVRAIDETGRLLAELALPVLALDWEDIAIGPGRDGSPALWVADIGDNLALRPTVTIYRLPEPVVAASPVPATPVPLAAAGLERFTVRYPDGPHDAETFLVDPATGDAFIVGKATDQDSTVPVYRLPASALVDGATIEAEPVGRIVGRRAGRIGPTAGDISADGTLVLVSNGREGLLWLRDPAQPVSALFAAQPAAPCEVRPDGGEAVAFSVDGRTLWAVNEGVGATLRRFDRA
jgi:hypothetical protein